jgi:hypothetical protein
LDLSNLLRMMIAEHVAEYIERGQRAATARQQAQATALPGPTKQAHGQKKAPQESVPLEPRRRSILIDPAQTL